MTAEPHHHLVLQNPYVRVFKVEIQPGQTSLSHRHGHDYVYVMQGASQISNEVQGKPPVQRKLQDCEANALDGGYSHVVQVLGSTPFRNVTVELLQDEKARKSPLPKWDEERGLQVLDHGTVDIMFVKDGVRVSEVELQAGGAVPKSSTAGPLLVIAITRTELRTSDAAKPVILQTGDTQWIPGGSAHLLANAGPNPAKFITLEFQESRSRSKS